MNTLTEIIKDIRNYIINPRLIIFSIISIANLKGCLESNPVEISYLNEIRSNSTKESFLSEVVFCMNWCASSSRIHRFGSMIFQKLICQRMKFWHEKAIVQGDWSILWWNIR